MEVLQFVRPDDIFAALHRSRGTDRGGDQFRADLRCEDLVEHRIVAVRQRVVRGDPAHQVLDERLGDARIHVVVRHVVAHAIRAPAQRQFAQVASADDEAAVHVGQAKQVAGALAGLHVLERDVVDGGAAFAARIRVPDIGQHAFAARPDVDLVRAATHRLHQPARLFERARAGREAGHGVGQDVGARQAGAVHRGGADEQRMGRVEAARDADDELLCAGCRDALQQRIDLDVVDLHAALVAPRHVVGHIREAVDGALQRAWKVVRQAQLEADAAEPAQQQSVLVDRGAERVLPHALARDALQVDIGADEMRTGDEARRFDEQIAAFVDQRLAVPAEVGCRFPETRR